jgi:hypothetical protein
MSIQDELLKADHYFNNNKLRVILINITCNLNFNYLIGSL